VQDVNDAGSGPAIETDIAPAGTAPASEMLQDVVLPDAIVPLGEQVTAGAVVVAPEDSGGLKTMVRFRGEVMAVDCSTSFADTFPVAAAGATTVKVRFVPAGMPVPAPVQLAVHCVPVLLNVQPEPARMPGAATPFTAATGGVPKLAPLSSVTWMLPEAPPMMLVAV
jgi:hypothetical protein